MNDERWEALKQNLTRNFKVEEEGTEDLVGETADGLIKQGTAEFLVIESPMGRIKLSRESRPLVLDKKFIYSHRAGQAARTEYEFSDTELTHKLKVSKWDDLDEEWKEIDASSFVQ